MDNQPGDQFEPGQEEKPKLPSDEVEAAAEHTDTPPAPNLQPDKPEHSKKKVWFWLFLLLLVLAAAVAYYFYNEAEENTQETANQESTEVIQTQSVNYLYYQADTNYSRLNAEDQSSTTVASLPENASILAINEDGSEFVYMTSDGDLANSTTGVLNFFKVEGDGQPQQVHKSTAVSSPFAASAAVSADLTQVAYFATNQSDSIYENAKIYTAPLDGSNTETVLVEEGNSKVDRGPLRPLVFSSDNKTVFMGEASCYFCDGPIKPSVWSANTTDNSITQVFTPPGQLTSGSTVVSTDASKIAISATEHSLNVDVAKAQNFPFDVYVLDLSDNSNSKIYSKQGDKEGQLTLSGWSQDSQTVIVGVNELSEGENESTFNSTFVRFDFVPSAGGSPSPFPISLNSLNNSSGFITEATTYQDQLFFIVTGLSQSGSETADNLYSLPTGGGETSINTVLSGQSSINILGSATIEE